MKRFLRSVRCGVMLGLSLVAMMLVPNVTRAADTSFSGVNDRGPIFDPLVFFTGHTRSWGVFENRQGEATEIIRTETSGRVVNGELRMEQDLYFSKRAHQHRSWRMRRVDAHHFEATANDLIGTARGDARGNTFVWTFTLATKPGNPLYNVSMTQRMYLQPDGRTMINRDTIRKFGVIVAEVTEQFRKL
ncbi:MAG: DUF3833 family protein [Chthoniobacter sp.]|uniref:DUF3833 family protein n=1 Tax=Chthoniobacter sp. TaxID=2510640 RepID=UPI0032A74DA1